MPVKSLRVEGIGLTEGHWDSVILPQMNSLWIYISVSHRKGYKKAGCVRLCVSGYHTDKHQGKERKSSKEFLPAPDIFILHSSHWRTQSNRCTCLGKALPCLQTLPAMRIVGEFLASFVVCTDHIIFHGAPFQIDFGRPILQVLLRGSAELPPRHERRGKQPPSGGTRHINSAVWPFASPLLGEWQNHRSYLSRAGGLLSALASVTNDKRFLATALQLLCKANVFIKAEWARAWRAGRRLTVCLLAEAETVAVASELEWWMNAWPFMIASG